MIDREAFIRAFKERVKARGPVAVPTGTSKPLPKAGPLEPSMFLPAKPGEREGTQLYQRREAPKPTLGQRLTDVPLPGAGITLKKLGEGVLPVAATVLTPLAKATEWYDKMAEENELPSSDALFLANPGLRVVGGLEQAAIQAKLVQAGRAAASGAKAGVQKAAPAVRRLATEEVGAVGKVPKKPLAMPSGLSTEADIHAYAKTVRAQIAKLANRPYAQASEVESLYRQLASAEQNEIAALRAGKPSPSVTTPVASEALSPAAEAAQATEGVMPKTGAQARTAIKVGDTVHRDGVVLGEVVDVSDSALLSIRSPQGGVMKAGRATVDETKAPVGARRTPQPSPESVQQMAAESRAAPTGAPSAAGQVPPSPAPAAPPGKPPRRPLWADIPPEPPREPSRMPPVGEKLPSGRRPGGPERMKPSAPSDNYARLQEALAPDKEPMVARLRSGLNTFMERFSDRNHAFWQLQKETGIPVHDLAQVVPGSTAAGQNIVRKLTYPIYSALGKDVKFLEEYMVLLRASDILALNPAARLPGGIEGAAGLLQAQKALAKKLGPERLAAVSNAAEQLWKVNDEQVRMALVREGIITKATRNAMNADHPHYIPFQRADFTDTLAEGMARPEASVSSTGILRMAAEGSERALADPLVRMNAQIIKTQQVIFRNRAAKAVVQSLIDIQNSTGQEFVRFIEPKRTLNIAERVTGAALPRATKAEHSKIWETISYFENGEKVTVEVPAIYGRVAKGLDGEAGGLFSQVARALSAPLRQGAVTYNPAFLIINPLRDATSAFWRERLIPFSPEYFKGWSAVIQKNATFEEAAQSGALLSGIVDTMKSTKALTRAKDIGNLTVHNPKDALLLIPRLLERMNITAEQATRVAVFRKVRLEGADALTAAVKARNATVDFAKMGTTMRIINDVYPFSNAALQGTINTFAVIKNNPKWAAIAASPFVVLTVMSRVNNMRFETSDQIPDYWYGSYWVFQFAEGVKPDGTKFPIYFKMPKGPVGSLLTFPGEALFNAARAQEDRSSVELLLQAGLEAAKSTSPVEPTFGGLVPTAAGQTLAGLATGVDLYRGQPIVPAREEQLAPEQQFGPETSKTAIALGTRFKVSPRLIDFAINDYLAGGGQSSNWMLSAALDAVGYKPEPFGAAREEAVARRLTPVEQISKAPVTSRFLGTTGNQLERRGWEHFREAVAATNQEFSRIPGMNSLGVRLGSVGDSIDMRPGAVGGSRDLTPQERANYQLVMAQVVNSAMPDYVATITITEPELRRKRIQKQMDSLKDKARDNFIKQLRAPRSQPTPSGTPIRIAVPRPRLRELEPAR